MIARIKTATKNRAVKIIAVIPLFSNRRCIKKAAIKEHLVKEIKDATTMAEDFDISK